MKKLGKKSNYSQHLLERSIVEAIRQWGGANIFRGVATLLVAHPYTPPRAIRCS